jgi:hypothetical protein
VRKNAQLHAKLEEQLAAAGGTPRVLYLRHDEIDEWRNQFDIVIPVHMLAYRGIPIEERDAS